MAHGWGMKPGLKGCGLVFFLFPVAHAIVQASFDWQVAQQAGTLFLLIGLGLVLASLKISSEAAQAVIGLLAGFFLWAAVGEVPHHTGHGFHVGPENWGLLLVIGTYYSFNRTVHPSRQGLQIAFEFFLVVWALHVLLLTAYYDPRFGVESWMTKVIFWVSAALILPLIRSVKVIRDLGGGIRRGVLVASALWTLVEILMKWQILPKPWKPMNPWAVAFFVGLLMIWAGWPVAGCDTMKSRAKRGPSGS